MSPQPAPERVIKRYDNRKLYDTRERRYVTLEALAAIVAGGEDVRVVDQRTGEDLTTLVLAQVILEGVKQRSADVPRQVLARLIRLGARGGAWSDAHPEPVSRASSETERIVADLISRGRLSLEEALALRHAIGGVVQRLVSDTQRGIERRLAGLLEHAEAEQGVSPALQALKERLFTLESWLGAPKRPVRPPARRARRASRIER